MSSFGSRPRNLPAYAYRRSDSSSSSTSSSTYSGGEEVAVPMNIEQARARSSSNRSGRNQQQHQRESSMFSSFMMSSFSPSSSSATASSASLSRKRITERTAKLQAVGQDAKENWKTLPQPYKVDKEFVLYALNNSSIL